MITEALQYAATTPVTPPQFRPFVGASVSLWSRAGRCARQWAGHEESCRSFVSDTISDMKQRRTAVVLGSGLVRDIPIEELSRAFDTVVLVDLVHLATVRVWLKAHRLRNIRLISRDLSGLEEAMAGVELTPLSFLRQVPYLDFVISANLLSQIGVGVERRFASEGPETEVLTRRLLQAHVDALEILPCTTVLLTDTSFRVTRGDGAVLEQGDLLRGVALPEAQASWRWQLAPLGEESRSYSIEHDVVAVRQMR